MNFKTLCAQKGGRFEQGVGCFIKDDNADAYHRLKIDLPHRDGERFYYEASKTDCEKNGDEMVHFGLDFLQGIQICRELGASEICEKKVDWSHKHNIAAITAQDRLQGWVSNYRQQLEACFDEYQFPDHKLEQMIDHSDERYLSMVIKQQKLSSALINRLITTHEDLMPELFGVGDSYAKRNSGKPLQVITSENIDLVLKVGAEKGKGFHELFTHHKLSQKQIAKAIRIGKNLSSLYTQQRLDKDNIDNALMKAEGYAQLFQYQKLTSAQITEAIDSPLVRSSDLQVLYEHQAIEQKHIDQAFESGKGQFAGLAKNKKLRLSSRELDRILKGVGYSSQNDLREIFQKYKLTAKQVDTAITKGQALDTLVKTQNLTDAQVKRIIKTCQGYELYELYSKAGALTPENVDLALEDNRNYIAMLYQYQTMNSAQITKAIDLGINREAVYSHQKLNDEQLTKAIGYELAESDNELQKKQLFSSQQFNNNHINLVIQKTDEKNDEDTLRQFMESQPKRLSKTQIKKVVDFADKVIARERYNSYQSSDLVNSLFETQTMDEDLINYCIQKEVSLQMIYSSYGEQLSVDNVTKAIQKGKHLDELYTNAKLNSGQIDAALKKGDVKALLQSKVNVLSTKQVNLLIKEGKESDLQMLFGNYTRNGTEKNLDSRQIDLAMERRKALAELYQNNVLEPYQIDNAIGMRDSLYHMYCNPGNTLTDRNYENAIRVGADLQNLYTCRKNLPGNIIDLALEKGEALHELYEHQHFNSAQLTKAIQLKAELPQLYAYQIKNFKPVHFDLLIPNADENLLYKIYTDATLNLSDVQRESVAKKISDELGMVIPPASIVHTRLHPKFWKEFEEKKQRSVENRIKERPMESLIGVYPLSVENPWQDIIKMTDDLGYRVSDDGVYAINKENPMKVLRLGKLMQRKLKDNKHPTMRKYQVLMSQKIRPAKFTSAALKQSELEDLEVVISNDPNDIAAKGTGHLRINEGCETVQSGMFGWKEWTKEELEGKKPAPHHGCGWCDDIKSNNLIAYLRNKKERDPRRKWHDRSIIRWCVREDDKKPDAIIETIYGEEHFKPMLREVLTKILNSQGFTGTKDGHACNTPYPYTGYADNATVRYPNEGNLATVYKTYKLAPRPQGIA